MWNVQFKFLIYENAISSSQFKEIPQLENLSSWMPPMWLCVTNKLIKIPVFFLIWFEIFSNFPHWVIVVSLSSLIKNYFLSSLLSPFYVARLSPPFLYCCQTLAAISFPRFSLSVLVNYLFFSIMKRECIVVYRVVVSWSILALSKSPALPFKLPLFKLLSSSHIASLVRSHRRRQRSH